MSLSPDDLELAQQIEAAAKHVAAAMRRTRNVHARVVPGARKRAAPLTSDDRGQVHGACTAYVLAESARYDPQEWAWYLAGAAPGRVVLASNDAVRQLALYGSLCTALGVCKGHQRAQASLRTAYERAFAAVLPLKQDPGDLVLDLDALLGRRRGDIPAEVRAQIAYAYAHAIDPQTYPAHNSDPARAKKDIEMRRRRRRQRAQSPKRARDLGVLAVL